MSSPQPPATSQKDSEIQPEAAPATADNKADSGAEPKPSEPGPGEPGPTEIGGPKGPEPTRYGDWEHKGRCIDF